MTEHEEIMNAILHGHGVLAEQLLKDHVMIQGDRMTDFVARFNELR